MKRFFQKQREAIIILSYIVAIAALVYFVILPLLARINLVGDQIQEKTLQQQIVEKQLNDLPKMEEQYNYLSKNEGLIDVLLDRNNAVALIEKLEKLAENSGNKITISVQETSVQSSQMQVAQKTASKSSAKKDAPETIIDKLPSADYLQMKISITGDYNAIENFISTLENFEYYSDIIGIQIRQGEAGEGLKNGSLFDSAPVADKKTDNIIEKKELEAVLDVVFYTKN